MLDIHDTTASVQKIAEAQVEDGPTSSLFDALVTHNRHLDPDDYIEGIPSLSHCTH